MDKTEDNRDGKNKSKKVCEVKKDEESISEDADPQSNEEEDQASSGGGD